MKNHPVHSVIALLFLLLLTGLRETGAVETAVAASPPLIGQVTELLNLLQTEKLVQAEDPAVRRKVLQNLVDVIDCGARYEAAVPATANPGSPPAATPVAVSAPVLLRQTIIYLTLQTFSPTTGAELKKVLDAAAPKKKWGLILDLRNLTGGNVIDVLAAAEPVTIRKDLPLVLLLGRETIGGGELLALVLKNHGGILIGQPTHGCLASLEPHALTNGDRVWLPHPVPEIAGIPVPAGPLSPHVAVTEQTVPGLIDGLTPERFEALPDRDQALRKAVELLTTVIVLGEKRF